MSQWVFQKYCHHSCTSCLCNEITSTGKKHSLFHFLIRPLLASPYDCYDWKAKKMQKNRWNDWSNAEPHITLLNTIAGNIKLLSVYSVVILKLFYFTLLGIKYIIIYWVLLQVNERLIYQFYTANLSIELTALGKKH